MRILLKAAALGCAIVCILILAQRDSIPKRGAAIWVGQQVIAEKTVHSEPIPVPPLVTVAGSQGVMVCSVLIDKTGSVSDVTVLQAPHAILAETVPVSILTWTFAATTVGGNPTELTGKVVRYLVNDGVSGAFLTPSQMVERNSLLRSQRPKQGPKGDPRSTQLVDVRDRDQFTQAHTSEALNIPLDELQVRGPVELSKDRDIGIECTRLSTELQNSSRILEGKRV